MNKQELAKRYAFAVESALESLQKEARIINSLEGVDENPTAIADLVEVLQHVERVEDKMRDTIKDLLQPQTPPTP